MSPVLSKNVPLCVINAKMLCKKKIKKNIFQSCTSLSFSVSQRFRHPQTLDLSLSYLTPELHLVKSNAAAKDNDFGLRDEGTLTTENPLDTMPSYLCQLNDIESKQYP